jgi:hypothetical protein
MEKRVREKTCPVLGSLLARTVDAIKAALVLRLAGKFLFAEFNGDVGAGEP